MPEKSRVRAPGTSDDTGKARETGPEPRLRWLFYGLGLSLQTFLWFLLFLAIAVAVLVGNQLTEFRYVGI